MCIYLSRSWMAWWWWWPMVAERRAWWSKWAPWWGPPAPWVGRKSRKLWYFSGFHHFHHVVLTVHALPFARLTEIVVRADHALEASPPDGLFTSITDNPGMDLSFHWFMLRPFRFFTIYNRKIAYSIIKLK